MPSQGVDDLEIRKIAAEGCGVRTEDINSITILRRSIDARKRAPKIILRLRVYANEEPEIEPRLIDAFPIVDSERRAIIVGAGPAGYFAAIELIQAGIQPVIFERGKDVKTRRRDIAGIHKYGDVNPDSNYCFGEGGAGAYSDGKLYTSAKKRGSTQKILQLFVEHGADPDILFDAHPHIGSNKLPKVVRAIRETILNHGGKIYFNSRVTDLTIKNGVATGVVVNDSDKHLGMAVILATGHSARDVFSLLHRKRLRLEAKPFAMGIRIEHPQALIDQIQYGQQPRDPFLPAATYKLVTHIKGRGVFSFCMCPGGLIVPSSTAPGELVVNGMSMARRDSEFANSGIVVAMEPDDLSEFAESGELRCLKFQQSLEKAVFAMGDGSQAAPAQRMVDFVEGIVSADLNSTSYSPGIYPAPLHEILPRHIANRLQAAFLQFGAKMRGYYTNEANIVGIESRTSSPIRIPRNRENCMHVEIKNLYPCGEGAGYAGGIVSSALDGQLVAKSIAGVAHE